MVRLFEMCVGGLKWSPKAFWRSTPAEIFMAIDGHNLANRPGVEPMLSDEFEALREEYPD